MNVVEVWVAVMATMTLATGGFVLRKLGSLEATIKAHLKWHDKEG